MLTERPSRWKRGGQHLRTKRGEQKLALAETGSATKVDSGGGRGSWLKSKIVPLLSSWLQPFRRYKPDECFFPFPKITFLIDQPTNLVCQICRETELKVTSESETPLLGDSTVGILPCGHVAGLRCLETWLHSNKSCPFCRLAMTYSVCGHDIPLRLVTTQSVHLLPPTLPDLGHIPCLCAQCLRESLLMQSELRFEQAAQSFRDARRRFHEGGGEAGVGQEALLAARDDFETLLRNEVYVRQLTTWLTSW